MLGGKISLSLLLIVMVPAMILVTLFCYYMAVKYDSSKPFPHETVTHTASFYPQNIAFRYIMLIFSSTLTLVFYTIIKWMDFTAVKVGFKKLPKYFMYSGMFSMFCYAVTISTIDGRGTGKWHGPCAVAFFVIWVIGIINFTVYLTKLHNWDASTLSKNSLIVKQLLAGYVALVWIYCVYNILLNSIENKEDTYAVIV